MSGASVLIVFLGLAVIFHEGYSIFLPKRANGYAGRDKVIDPKKRPFCNAFTGCGRKRSNLPVLPEPELSPQEETIGSLLELSAEPAVEDLSRQIMSEAKLWEAIQEANAELQRRKGDSQEVDSDGIPVSRPRSAAGSCALPPCYI